MRESFPLFGRVPSSELVFQQSPEADRNCFQLSQSLAVSLLCPHCLVFGPRESLPTRLLGHSTGGLAVSFSGARQLSAGFKRCAGTGTPPFLHAVLAVPSGKWYLKTISRTPGVSSPPGRSRFLGLSRGLRSETVVT